MLGSYNRLSSISSLSNCLSIPKRRAPKFPNVTVNCSHFLSVLSIPVAVVWSVVFCMGEGGVWEKPGAVGKGVLGWIQGLFNRRCFSCLPQASSLWWFSPFSAPWSSSSATCSATRAPTTPTRQREQSQQRAPMLPSWTTTPISQRPLTRAKRNGSSEGWLVGCGRGRGELLGRRERDKSTLLHTLEHILKISAQVGGGKQQKILEMNRHTKKILFNISL